MSINSPRSTLWLSFIFSFAVIFSVSSSPGLASQAVLAPLPKAPQTLQFITTQAEPWLKLSAVQPAGASIAGRGLELLSLSLAGAELNGDQAVELVAGYASADGGLLAVYPGNPDPSSTAPFLPQAAVVSLPHAPTWLGSGDFNADGNVDVIAAGRDAAQLTLLPGDGAGNLGEPQIIPLDNGVTALAVGELDRKDGLPDIAVALENGQVLVYSGDLSAPALRRTLELPTPAAALAIGQLDEHYAYDLAILAGTDLYLLHGQDQFGADDLNALRIERIPLGFSAVDLALGDFQAPDGQLLEIAVLASDGSLHLYDHQGQALADSPLNQVRSETTSGAHLLRAKTSTLPADDLLLLEPAGDSLGVYNASSTTASHTSQLAGLESGSAPQAALSLRLNGDALSDLVFMDETSFVPQYALTEPNRVFVVNGDWWDVDDEDIGDGVCETLSWLDGTHCNLRAAIQEANASAGLDEIQLSFPTAPSEALPQITEALILSGTDPNAEVNGANAGLVYGLHFTSGSSTIQDIKVRQFSQPAIYLQTGGGHLIDGVQLGGGNLNNGLTIETDSNTVQYSIIVGNSSDGIYISGGDENLLRNNWIGLTASGVVARNLSSGVALNNADNNDIGGLAGYRNVISGNENGGIEIVGGSAGTVVQSNFIGLKDDGVQPLGNTGLGGVKIGFARGTTIGGASTLYRNYISANQVGIAVQGNAATGTVIRNNYFGLTAAGAGGVGNLTHAINLNTTTSGTSVQVSDNLLAGGANSGHGILISNAVTPAQCIAHTINNNVIGANADRNAAHGFGQDGIHIEGVDCVTLTGNSTLNSADDGIEVSGGAEVNATLTGNLAAGNARNGIELNTPFNNLTNNSTTNNFNGVNVNSDSNTLTNTSATYNTNTGMVILGDDNLIQGPGDASANLFANSFEGLVLAGNDNTVLWTHIENNSAAGVRVSGDDNVIGGPINGNWINGNAYGIEILEDAESTQLIDNFIGVAADGETPAGNAFANILVQGINTSIGGTDFSTGNVIADAPVGILIQNDSYGANIRYNRIGTNADGGAGLPNTTGIKIENGSDNSITDNQIAYNGDGVIVQQGTGNRITANSIYNSTRLALDLYPTGVTINDTGDTDSGANNLQNYPVISAAGNSGTASLIQASFIGAPNTYYDFDYYSTPFCDPSGHGEAMVHVGHSNWTTNANGEYFTNLLVSPLTLNEYVTATATDPQGNTSELSPCVKIGVLGGSETITVNQTTDAADANIGDAVCDSDLGAAGEQCSLRAAVQQANANSGANTILLSGGDYLLSRAGTDNTALNGDLDITGDLTIIGAGAHLTRVNGNNLDRVFDVRSPAVVTLRELTVTGGNPGSSAGGGIIVNGGATLNLESVSVQSNQVGAAGGGGIYNLGTLNASNSAVIGNTAGMNGGGLYQFGGGSTWLNSTFSGNQAAGHGGAIAAETTTVTLSNVTIAYNTADTNNTGEDGGGLYQSGASVSLQNSIVAQNTDLSYESYEYGHADCFGSYTSNGYNLIGDQALPYGSSTPGCTLSGGTGDSLGGTWLLTNYLTWYAGLEPALELNGGSTPSHSPIASASGMSVDWGNPGTPGTGGGTCEAFDQRGQARPIDGGTDGIPECDRGAVELIPVTIRVNDVTVTEGGVAEFQVSISDSIQIPFTVNFSVSGLSAVAGSDFVATSGTLSFAAGETLKTIPVTTLTDTFDEADETFQVVLSQAQYVLVADGVGIGTILDGSPQPSILINDASVTESAPGEITTATFNVTLNSPSEKTVTVDYTLEEVSALAGDDYISTSGTLTFSPGVTSQSLPVTVLGDNLQEGTETYSVRLANPVNASTSATGTGTIVDDDIPSFSINDAWGVEGDSGASAMYFYVFLSKPSAAALSVSYQTTPGTAQTSLDFQNNLGTLSFAPGETVKYIPINIVGDTVEESLETFTLTLNTPTGGSVIGDGSATGTIEDNDGPLTLPQTKLFLPILRH